MKAGLTPSQQRAQNEIRAQLAHSDLCPTYVLAGPSGCGKTTAARLLGGDYHNFTLEWMDEFFAERIPLFLRSAELVDFLLAKVSALSARWWSWTASSLLWSDWCRCVGRRFVVG